MPQCETGLLQHFPGIVGQRHLGIALEVCRTHVSWIPSGALTAVTEQSHQLSCGDLDLAFEAGDVFGQRLLDLVELSLRPGIFARGEPATTWDSSVSRACLDVRLVPHAPLVRPWPLRPSDSWWCDRPFSAAGLAAALDLAVVMGSPFLGQHG